MNTLNMVCAVAEECFRWHHAPPFAVYSSRPLRSFFIFTEPYYRPPTFSVGALPIVPVLGKLEHVVRWEVFCPENLPLCSGLFQSWEHDQLRRWWFCNGVAVIERRP